MEVEFELIKEDYVKFNLYHFAHSPSLRPRLLRRTIVIIAVWILVLLMLILASETPARAARGFWPLYLGPPIYLLLFFRHSRAHRRVVERMLEEGKNKGMFGLQQVSLSSAGISTTSEARRSSSTWEVVERIESTEDSAYFYVSSVEAIIVPRRAFGDDADFEEFVEAGRRYHSRTN